MIDTIVLTLSEGMFAISQPDRFEPSARGLLNKTYTLGARGYMKCQQNPTSAELKAGIYRPRLTLTRRIYNGTYQLMLKIEFSIPKLLFGNNFDEISEESFLQAVEILRIKLKEMGVFIFGRFLIQAPVSAIHYSKNFPLTDGSIPYTYLKEISKVNMTKRYDLNQTDFRNEGHSIKYHTNSFEIAFYDKMKDMEQAKISEKRAVEQNNFLQLDLFEELKTLKPLEVLRMEVRLNRRQKIRQVLKQLGFEIEPTFQNLFKKAIAQRVLLHYIEEIENGYPTLVYYQSKSPKQFISDYIFYNPQTIKKKALQTLGLKNLLDEVGLREARKILKYADHSWYRLYKEISDVKMPQSFNCFSMLKGMLEKFELLSVASLQVPS